MGQAAETVQALYAAFGRGDVPAVLEMLEPEVDWTFVGPPEGYPVFGRRKGREGALAFFQALGETEDIEVFEPQAFHEAGDSVAVEGRAALTLKTNGRKVAYDWVHLWTVRNGKVTRLKGFTDTAALVEAFRR
jgi:ketosteroid isomerase-like protein